MNPLHWKTAHQVALALTVLAGAVVGIIFGWLASPFAHLRNADTGTSFLAWLHYPSAYWPWLLGGVIAGGLSYYAADLLTGAR